MSWFDDIIDSVTDFAEDAVKSISNILFATVQKKGWKYTTRYPKSLTFSRIKGAVPIMTELERVSVMQTSTQFLLAQLR